MKKSELMKIIKKYPYWECAYILRYEISASVRLIYRGWGQPRIPELDNMDPDDSYPLLIKNESFDDFPDYRIDVPDNWLDDDLPGGLPLYSPR